MSVLTTKLRRDISAHKYQFITIVIVVFLGIALFAASHDSYKNLKNSYKATHKILAFADLTFGPTQFADKELNQVKKIEGVAKASGRITADIPLKLSPKKKILGRVVGFPSEAQPDVNKLSLIRGSYFQSSDDYKVLVEKHFAEYHHLKKGDKLGILLPMPNSAQPRWQKFTVSGIGISPEYIWVAKSRQDIMPSPENFGVLFVPLATLQKTIGKSPQQQFKYNELVILLEKGASIQKVKKKIQEIRNFNPNIPVLTKKDQPSNAALNEDLEGFNELSVFFPFVFLSIGAMAIYVMLTRMVYTQRAQIGVLRANGYTKGRIIRHYLSYGLITGITGSIIGVVIGILTGGTITRLYTSVLSIPIIKTEIYPDTAVTGVIIALVFTLIAVWAPARTASAIQPAQAMRGEIPSGRGKRSLFERLIPFLKRLSPQWKIPIRGIGRNRRRSLSTIIGIIFAIVLILMSWGMLDTVNYLLERQFKDIQTQDLKVYFSQPVTENRIKNLENMVEIENVEPLVELPVTLKHGDRHYTTVIQALPQKTQMHRFYLEDGTRIKLRKSGLLVGRALKDKLGIEKGDIVEFSIMNQPVKARVTGFLNEALGTYVYIALREVQSHFPEILKGKKYASSAQIKVKKGKQKKVKDKLSQISGVAGVEDSRALYEMINKFNKFFYAFVGVMLVFGCLMAFALIFNTMTVNIFERSREIATLKTLGIGKRRISYLVTTENILLVLLGIAPGLVIGHYMSEIAMRQFSSDLFSFDLFIYPMTYVYTALAIIIVALISQWPALRAVHQFSLAKAIKERST